MYENLRIRAYLQTGIISDQYFPLEGMLLYLKFREKYETDRVNSAPNELMIKNNPSDFVLPLDHEIINGKKIYSLSFAQWSKPVAEDIQNYAKRFDLALSDVIDFKQRRAMVNTIGGEYKNQFIKVYYRHSLFIDWYARGIKNEIQKLIQHAFYLGKKSAQGWGSVLRWEVETIEDNYSFYKKDKLMRSIPDASSKFIYGYKAPFWLPENQTRCMLP